MNVQAAIFDIGNVLLFFDYYKAAGRLMEKNHLTSPPDKERIAEIIHQFEVGKMSREDFLIGIRREFHDTGDEEEFLKIWCDIFQENVRMTALATRLSELMPVYLLSNVGLIHHEYVLRMHPFFSVFKDGIFSYRVGLMKPERAVYELARDRFGLVPEETIYFDDIQENCDAAASVGFVSLQYDSSRIDLPQAWGVPLINSLY